MSGFQFPPPPPPPPKSYANFDSQQSNQSANSNRGRGRGRGRGGNDGRGRGSRGGRGGSDSGRGSIQQSSSSNGPHNPRFQPTPIAAIPPGSYVNPAFQFGHFQPVSAQDSPQRTAAGHKRKLDALRGPQPAATSKSLVAPAVPSFGAPILPLSPERSTFPLAKNPQQRKRTTNVLGLTPAGEPQYSSSESEYEDVGVDEEAMFAELGSTLTFEHNGTVLSLNSAADLATWKTERSKNFPTKARTAQKLEEKRQIGGERRRMLMEASNALREARRPRNEPYQPKSKPDASKPSGERKPETDLEKAKRELDSHKERLDNLRKQVAKSAAIATKLKAQKVARAAQSPHATAGPDEAGDENEDPAQDDQDAEDAEFASSTESSVISSDSSDGSDDDDGPPEQLTSKLPQQVPGEAKPLCKFYVASGQCRDGDGCRFRHELPERGTGAAYREIQDQQQRRQPKKDPYAPPELATVDRKTIFQRMMEQEHGGEDQLALQVIKYLGRVNFFAQKSGSGGNEE